MFSEKLLTLRKKANLTQDELANSIFVSRSTVAKWEQGRSLPSDNILLRIAKVFDISIDELIEGTEITFIKTTPSTPFDNLYKRAEICLKDGDYDKANELAEIILNEDYLQSRAYLIKLAIDLKVDSMDGIKESLTPISENKNFLKAYEFADEETKNELQEISNHIQEGIIFRKKEQIYQKALKKESEKRWNEAIFIYEVLDGYKDANTRKEICNQIVLEQKYIRAKGYENLKNYLEAKKIYEELGAYKDAKTRVDVCRQNYLEDIYQRALSLEKKHPSRAHKLYQKILSYKDVKDRLENLKKIKKKWMIWNFSIVFSIVALILAIAIPLPAAIKRANHSACIRYIENKEYEKAEKILDKWTYSDQEELKTFIRAGEFLENKNTAGAAYLFWKNKYTTFSHVWNPDFEETISVIITDYNKLTPFTFPQKYIDAYNSKISYTYQSYSLNFKEKKLNLFFNGNFTPIDHILHLSAPEGWKIYVSETKLLDNHSISYNVRMKDFALPVVIPNNSSTGTFLYWKIRNQDTIIGKTFHTKENWKDLFLEPYIQDYVPNTPNTPDIPNDSATTPSISSSTTPNPSTSQSTTIPSISKETIESRHERLKGIWKGMDVYQKVFYVSVSEKLELVDENNQLIDEYCVFTYNPYYYFSEVDDEYLCLFSDGGLYKNTEIYLQQVGNQVEFRYCSSSTWTPTGYLLYNNYYCNLEKVS